MKTIIEVSNIEAEQFFVQAANYCNIDLPKYFNFQPLLTALLNDNAAISTIGKDKVKKYQNVNYKFYNNKDGAFAWRPLQLINPALYVQLVKVITKKDNWEIIVKRFSEFQQDEHIKCCSMPLFTLGHENPKKDTILNWWDNIEQQSLELSLEYNCMLNTDITDCYGSIYTHSISWAIHGKKESQENSYKGGPKLLGDDIDTYIRNMSSGQTNGIPQGSVLMDFIAEIILGYADIQLIEHINAYNATCCKNQCIEDYKILRYRDDYRIFSNSQETLVKVAKILTSVLQDLNFRINTQKTFITTNIIKDSIKADKYYWNEMKQEADNLQKYLLLIHSLSQKHQNSGSLAKALDDFYKGLYPLKVYKANNIKALISILVDIAYRNPRVYPITCAIIGKLLILETNKAEKDSIYTAIRRKFNSIPNAGYMQVWLQRLTIKLNAQEEYDEKICKLINNEDFELWEISWAHDKIKKIFKENPIIDRIIIDNLTETPTPDEIKTFWSY
ncbi:MAG: RNA-directed DNA polymerase [Bacteroidales bacterium]|nr:RNA-directed DNA polymerase [Bacteroidales bacterium]